MTFQRNMKYNAKKRPCQLLLTQPLFCVFFVLAKEKRKHIHPFHVKKWETVLNSAFFCVRKTHDKIEHLYPSVQSMGRNSCYSYCFPPYPPIQFTVSFLSEKQCILSRKPAIFHHRRGDGDVYCMVNAPCLVWSMRKVPNDDGGGYGCGME